MKRRIPGITYLKAILPCVIVAIHAKPFGDSASMIVPLQSIPDWKDIVYCNVFTLAVPLFYMISFYLYLTKRDSIDYQTTVLMRERAKYFLFVFLITRLIFALFEIGQFWVSERGTIRNIYHLLFGGADTLLYYVEQMVYYIIILEGFCLFCNKKRLSRKNVSVIGLLISIGLILCVNHVFPDIIRYEAKRSFSPINVIPLIFIACYIYDVNCKSRMWEIIIILSGILISCIEWKILPDEDYIYNGISSAMPGPCRLSVLFLCSGIFMLALRIGKIPGKYITRMASLSLYVYLIHQIVIRVLYNCGFRTMPSFFYVIVLLTTYLLSYSVYIVNGKVTSHIN